MVHTAKLLGALDVIARKLNIEPADVEYHLESEGISAWRLYRDIERMGYHWMGEKWVKAWPAPAWYLRLKRWSKNGYNSNK